MTTIPPEARKAARDAVRYGGHLEGECPDQPGLARAACWCCVADVAITAALPHIEAAIREQVAGEIATSVPYNCELRPDGTEDHDSAIYVGALHDAWRIAKGDGDE